jgi:hypothetical protein|tara:strand:+ start:233 stop:385 length:153 start_codon:yes stop_codon:yes gene_type:complete
MKDLFDEIGLEGIIFLVIAMVCIFIIKISVEYSLVVAFIGAGLYCIKWQH